MKILSSDGESVYSIHVSMFNGNMIAGVGGNFGIVNNSPIAFEVDDLIYFYAEKPARHFAPDIYPAYVGCWDIWDRLWSQEDHQELCIKMMLDNPEDAGYWALLAQ